VNILLVDINVIILMAIGGYYINGYLVNILLVDILLLDIGGY